MNFENDGIIVGDISQDTLLLLLKRLQNNPILQFIARNPMGRLFEHVEASPKPEGYASICNLCQHALGDLRESQTLKRELAPHQDYFPFWLTAESIGLA